MQPQAALVHCSVSCLLYSRLQAGSVDANLAKGIKKK